MEKPENTMVLFKKIILLLFFKDLNVINNYKNLVLSKKTVKNKIKTLKLNSSVFLIIKKKNFFLKLNLYLNNRIVNKKNIYFKKFKIFKKFKLERKFYNFLNKKFFFLLLKKIFFYLKIKKIEKFIIFFVFKFNIKKINDYFYYIKNTLLSWKFFLFIKKIFKYSNKKFNVKYLYNKSHSNFNDKIKKKRRK